MFKLRRNQIIIAALVVMIGVAGYLNYLDTRTADDGAEIFTQTTGGEIGALVLDGLLGNEMVLRGDEAAVEAAAQAPADGADDRSEPGEAVFVSASTDSSFFVQARLRREQDRSRQKETLTNIMNQADIEQSTRNTSAETMLELTRRMESESATETALIAKGFGEAYVRIDDNWVEVIINRNVITDQELAQLEDIVTRLTGAAISQIRLSSVRN